ncbi:hypothetical protein [Floridanema evergladense]|uniref:Uncharacterized protein n=1 Tax=Floridaenema evergladense BLCC-F167 TaxID=3153639 RepID=A0ABV4WHF5_9CYAN
MCILRNKISQAELNLSGSDRLKYADIPTYKTVWHRISHNTSPKEDAAVRVFGDAGIRGQRKEDTIEQNSSNVTPFTWIW